jgi:IclR family transcriptional regulator, acetate operon repressor
VGTVSKALSLLDILAGPEARLGLTGIAKAAGFDKATTRRLLVELKTSGLVEQDEASRDYMLGPALLRLGRLRETRFPFARIAEPVVRALAEATGETAHASEWGGGILASVVVQASDKSNRVIVELGERLPLHATASGIAVLAASPPALVAAVLARPLTRFSAATLLEPGRVALLVEEARARGWSLSDGLKEAGVHSVAAAIRGPKGTPVGAVAVAMPSVRATPEILAQAGARAAEAAQDIAGRLYGARKGRG